MTGSLKKHLDLVVRTPPWPATVDREPVERNAGIDYDTAWSRRPVARATRRVALGALALPFARAVATPSITGLEHLDALAPPAIFVANHTSHLDTSLVLSVLPERFRKHTVVAAAADYFFDRPWKATASSLLLGAIPWDRTRVSRKSLDIAAELIADDWSLVMFPEGGRSPDGWGQEFHGYAAYLAKRCDVPLVPIHLRGVRPIIPKGTSRIRPGHVEVRVGTALRPLPETESSREEDARHFGIRIEAAVATLADEAESDWWSAQRRAAAGTTPPLRGPDAAPWRRVWALPESSWKPAGRNKGLRKPW